MDRDKFKKDNSIYMVLVPMLFFAVYVCYNIFYANEQRDKLNYAKYSIVTGRIDKFQDFSFGRNVHTTVKYKLNNELYKIKLFYDVPCRTSDIDSKSNLNELRSFRFPVAVSSLDDSYGIALLRPEDFKRIRQTFPDSLRYMYSKYFKCSALESFRADD